MLPDFQTMMLPLLNILSDGLEYTNSQSNQKISDYFNLSAEDLTEYLPSGTQTTFINRVSWAKSHLKRAGLIESPKRGVVRITDNGRKFLSSNPSFVNIRVLKRIINSDNEQDIAIRDDQDGHLSDNATPEEILENSYLTIKKNLAGELLAKIKSSSPTFFENLVVELLVKMGYGGSIQEAGKSIGKSGDEGIDGIIKEDKLGLDVIYLQAKRWEGSVGRPEIQKFVGALAGQGAKKGVFITTSKYTKEAREYQPRNETKIVLIDGEQLAELMIEYNLAVTIVNTFSIKKIDNDYFGEE